MVDDAWTWLDSLKSFGYNPSLENTAVLLSRLDMPQQSFPSIHVAGSNGKGTCCAILANALTLSGKCTGLFTSPHLISVNERVRIDGVPISDTLFEDFLKQIQEASKINPIVSPTFYEATFLVAMLAFRDQGVERAVIETGLGGRWDATKLVNSDCCILTKISLEHSEILGDTLEKIAAEKAAIVEDDCPVVSVDYRQYSFWGKREYISDFYENVRIGIEGEIGNKSEIKWINCFDFSIKDTAAELAKEALRILGVEDFEFLVEESKRRTKWPGRKQLLYIPNPDPATGNLHLILDAAHNEDGMHQISLELDTIPDVILFGCTQKHNISGIIDGLLQIITHERRVSYPSLVLTEPIGGRLAPVSPEKLEKEIAARASLHPDTKIWYDESRLGKIKQIPNCLEAFEFAKQKCFQMSRFDVAILCVGSVFLVGNILRNLGEDTESILGD